jgi:hypothetical protein
VSDVIYTLAFHSSQRFSSPKTVSLVIPDLYLLYSNCWFYFRNLQGAVCSYFDFESPYKLPSMSLVKDVTIGEGESIPPCTK